MSRSFVRAWATVATIMAMACFSFVLPAPAAHVTLEAKAHAPTPNDDQISSPLSFVDSPFSGKTFSPYLTISSLPLFPAGTSQPYALARAHEKLSPPSLEPLIRPG